MYQLHRQPRVAHGLRLSLEHAIMELLPPTGSVEVQRDTPGRAHPTYFHSTDETLLIVEGSITFSAVGFVETCLPGDRLLLPGGTVYASVAGSEGCVYVILMGEFAEPRSPPTGP